MLFEPLFRNDLRGRAGDRRGDLRGQTTYVVEPRLTTWVGAYWAVMCYAMSGLPDIRGMRCRMFEVSGALHRRCLGPSKKHDDNPGTPQA